MIKKTGIPMLLVMVTFCLAACKKEEPKLPEAPKVKSQEELLVGKWQLVQGYDLNGVDVAEDCDKENILEFFADKSMNWYSYQDNGTGCYEYFYHLTNDITYTLQGNEISWKWVDKEGGGSGELSDMTYEVNATTLTIRVTPTHKGTIYTRIS